jgi:uncharacterized glyoxalase superfamily protein PhnB
MAAKKKAKTAPKKSAARRPPAKAAAKKSAGAGGTKLSEASPSFTVNDLEKSIAFYTGVLGFAVDERWERDGKLMGVSLQAGKVTWMIGQDDWQKGRDRRKGEGFRLYCTTTENVDALARKIKSKGGKLDSEPADQPWGSRDFSLTDPDGFKITIGAENR